VSSSSSGREPEDQPQNIPHLPRSRPIHHESHNDRTNSGCGPNQDGLDEDMVIEAADRPGHVPVNDGLKGFEEMAGREPAPAFDGIPVMPCQFCARKTHRAVNSKQRTLTEIITTEKTSLTASEFGYAGEGIGIIEPAGLCALRSLHAGYRNAAQTGVTPHEQVSNTGAPIHDVPCPQSGLPAAARAGRTERRVPCQHR